MPLSRRKQQKEMGISKSILFTFLIALFLAFQFQAQDQSGFISIDCGQRENSNYMEWKTHINYISDDKFIDSGESKIIPAGLANQYEQQLWTLRSFPEGIRNCYRINVTDGMKYLIRTSFLYGNYDGLHGSPKFELHLGANLWDTVIVTNSTDGKFLEIINIPPLNYVQICLVNTGSGTPFISAIELRPLPNDTYVTDQFRTLTKFKRVDFGSSGRSYYRYSEDVHDRIWFCKKDAEGYTALNVSVSDDSFVQNPYQPPTAVMSTAVTPTNASAPLQLYWFPDDVTAEYYVYMHFAEIVELKNQTRAFNVSVNGNPSMTNYEPSYLHVYTVYTLSPVSGEKIEFLLEKTEQSTLPPIINAIEIYKAIEFSQIETFQEDVDAIITIKLTYGVTRNWQGDPCSPVAYLWTGVNCTYGADKPPRITTLNLSSSGLTGSIDPSISKFSMLEKLDLSNNNLNGPVPDFLSQLQFLKVLNLEKNNLTGSIPSGLIEKSQTGSLSLGVGENPYLCESLSCNKSNKNKIIVPIVASIGGVLLLLIAMLAIFWTLKKRKAKKADKIEKEAEETPMKPIKREYSYSDIVNITNNFDRIIGKGGFGVVYFGCIGDTLVAVKMLSASAVRGYQQLQAEVKLLVRVHHKNLSSLVGYCNEEDKKGLIYEYMANGNLEEHLSGKANNAKLLTWEDRLRIALDAGQGLEYLHFGCKPPIIHRDVKSTNILLDEKWEAKLSDFGLSKVVPLDRDTNVSTVVAGTPGYVDPEYYISNRLTEKSDVFSFGVVLLEIITSRAAITRNPEQCHITQWVSTTMTDGNISDIVGTRMHGDYDSNSVWKAIEIAMSCVSTDSNTRPTMSEVVIQLKDCLAMELASARTKHSGESTVDLYEITTEFAPRAR